MVLVFTDLVGSVALKTRLGNIAYSNILQCHDTLFRRIIADYPGAVIVSYTGDGFITPFPSSSSAVSASLRFQYVLPRQEPGRNAKRPGQVGQCGDRLPRGSEDPHATGPGVPHRTPISPRAGQKPQQSGQLPIASASQARPGRSCLPRCLEGPSAARPRLPTVPNYRNDLAATMATLAILLRHNKELGPARQLLEEALPLHQAVLQTYPRNPKYREFSRNTGSTPTVPSPRFGRQCRTGTRTPPT